MTKLRSHSALGRYALGACLAALAATVAAQMPGGGTGSRSAGGMRGARGSPAEAPAVLPPLSGPELVRLQLGELEEDLKLTPAQRPAFATYAERMRRLAEDLARARTSARYAEGPAPQQLDRLADIARDRLAAVEDIVDAGKALYATLAPAQREVADRRLARLGLPLVGAADATATTPRREGAPDRGGAPPDGGRGGPDAGPGR
jgi:hypothetical protein